MFLERARTLRASHATLDAVAIASAFGLAFLARGVHDRLPFLSRIPATPWNPVDVAGVDYALLLTVSLLAWIAGLRANRGYLVPHRGSLLRLLGLHAKGLTWAVLAASAAVFSVKLATVSRLYFGYFFGLGTLMLLAKDLFMRSFVRRLLASDTYARHALVIGGGRPASWFAAALVDAIDAGYRPVGVLWVDEDEAPLTVGGLPVLGNRDALDSVLMAYPVDEVFVVGGPMRIAELAPLVQLLTERGRVVSVVTTNHSTGDGVRGRVTEFEGIPMLSYGPMPRDELGDIAKRMMDLLVASLAALVLLPVALAVAVALKTLDPGPVLFGQRRLGRGGQQFTLYKFRSMRVDAEDVLRREPALYQQYVDNDFKLPEALDPRISRFGLFLRKSSLDELPQLFNVMRGDMSMVGPRPIVPDELQHYEPYADLFLTVRPGVTGLWQVSGRSAIRYPERAFLDLDYIGNHSRLADLSILMRTVPAVLLRKGAH
jgi:exopolysaccharide biosynthesis polyprenyl glycosylphosphotransferase